MTWSLVGSAGTVAQSTTSPQTLSLPQSSTAGNLLVIRIFTVGTSSNTTPTLPSGWTLRTSAALTTGAKCAAWIFENPNNAGSISSVSITFTGSSCTGMGSEYTCPNVSTAAFDQTGTVTQGTIGTSISPVTSGNLTAAHELGVSMAIADFSSATSTTYTAGSGFTAVGNWKNGVSASTHATFDDELDTGSSSGSTLTDAIALSTGGTGSAIGLIATYTQGVAPVTIPPVPPRLWQPIHRASYW